MKAMDCTQQIMKAIDYIQQILEAMDCIQQILEATNYEGNGLQPTNYEDNGLQPTNYEDNQGRRQVLKSGTAIEPHRRSARAEGTSRGGHQRGWGIGGISPEKIFKFKMSVEVFLMYFETMFACEIRLIVQAFHVAVFKRKRVRGISP